MMTIKRWQPVDTSVQEHVQMEPRKEMAASEGTRQYFSWCFKWPFEKKTGIILIIIVILVISNIILIDIWRSARNKPAASKSISPCSLYIISCPKSWVGYEGKCYYFSRAEETWDFSQRNCFSYGASLASIDTQQDMEFMIRYKISADHWIGLRRKGGGHPWKWTNGTIFNNWFNIGAKGFCAYLNDKEASSTRCDTLRNWICTKSLYGFHWEKLLSLSTNTSSLDSDYQLMKMNCSLPES